MEFSNNEQRALKIIFTDYLMDYNAYNLKDTLGVTAPGSLKLLKRLKERHILTDRKIGNATFYKVETESEYAKKLLELLYLDYSGQSNLVKGWIQDLKAITETKAVLLFGSILTKGKDANDVDVCFILRSHDDYRKLQKRVDSLSKNGRQKVHPLYLTEQDLKEKLRERDAPVVDMVRSCVVVCGQELFVRVLSEVQKG